MEELETRVGENPQLEKPKTTRKISNIYQKIIYTSILVVSTFVGAYLGVENYTDDYLLFIRQRELLQQKIQSTSNPAIEKDYENQIRNLKPEKIPINDLKDYLGCSFYGFAGGVLGLSTGALIASTLFPKKD